MTKRAMRPDDLYLLKTAGDPRISPDGARVAWVETVFDRDSDKAQMSILVAPADGSSPPRPFAPGPRDHSPRWSPDGRFLAFVSAPDDGPGQLHIAPLDGGVPRKVTDVAGGVTQPVWSPDGTRIVFVSVVDGPKPAKDRTPVERNAVRVVRGTGARLDNAGWYDGRRKLFVVDVDEGSVKQITTGDFDDDMPSWSPDGETIAFSSDRDRKRDDRVLRGDAWIVAASGGKPERLTRGRGRAAFPTFSPDGKLIAFVGGEHGDQAWDRDSKIHVIRTDGSDGGEPQPIAPQLDRPAGAAFLPVAPLAWLADGSLLFTVMDQGTMPLHRAKPGDRTSKVVLDGDRQVDGFSVTADGKRIAFTAVWPSVPSDVYVRQVSGGDERRIGATNDAFNAEIELGEVERASIQSSDGLAIEYFVVHPPAGKKKAGKAPLHLEIHGGPHGMHPMGMSLAQVQAMAAAGYLVLLPNPRGSNSYGQAFTEGCTGDWGGGDYDDLMRCVDDVVDRGLADPNRLYVGGYSYGGFMTSWVVGHTNRFKAAVVGAPVVNHSSMAGTTDIPAFSLFAMGGTQWERPDEYAKRSPISYLPDCTTPVLINHNEGDLRCPMGQSEELYTALKTLGKEVEFLRYPGGSHIARSPSQAVDRTERVLDWYARHGAAKPKTKAKVATPATARGRAGTR